MAVDAELERKVKQLIDEASEQYLGVNIDRLSHDLTARVFSNPFADIEVDATLKYREAKRRFRKFLLSRLLVLNLGNISEVAKILQVDRRSVHRMIDELRIDVRKIKKELVRPYIVRLSDINLRIERVLDNYKEIIHPSKLENMYRNVSSISDNILKELPEQHITLKQADDDFETRYLKKSLELNGSNVALTARKIGLRHETLFRKIKELGLK